MDLNNLPLGAEIAAPQTSVLVALSSSLAGHVERAFSYPSYVPAFDFVPEPLKRFESNRMGQSNDRQSRFQNW